MDILISYLAGTISSLIVVYLGYRLRIHTKEKNDKRTKEAIRVQFISTISSLIFFLSGRARLPYWQNTFWEKNQSDIAVYFPEEFLAVTRILMKYKERLIVK